MVGIARTATIRSTHPSDLSADAMRHAYRCVNGFESYRWWVRREF